MKRNRSCGIKGLAAALLALALLLAGCAGPAESSTESTGGLSTAESGSDPAEGTGAFLPLESLVSCDQKFAVSGTAEGAYIRLTRPDYSEVLAYVDYNSRYAVLGEADSRQKNRVLADAGDAYLVQRDYSAPRFALVSKTDFWADANTDKDIPIRMDPLW